MSDAESDRWTDPVHRKRGDGRETREEAAASISEALDFLGQEADAAGLAEAAELIRLASRKTLDEPDRLVLADACRAIAGLPEEYRNALVYRKVYRRSYQQIAGDFSVPIAVAKDRVMQAFQLVRGALPAGPAC